MCRIHTRYVNELQSLIQTIATQFRRLPLCARPVKCSQCIRTLSCWCHANFDSDCPPHKLFQNPSRKIGEFALAVNLHCKHFIVVSNSLWSYSMWWFCQTAWMWLNLTFDASACFHVALKLVLALAFPGTRAILQTMLGVPGESGLLIIGTISRHQVCSVVQVCLHNWRRSFRTRWSSKNMYIALHSVTVILAE